MEASFVTRSLQTTWRIPRTRICSPTSPSFDRFLILRSSRGRPHRGQPLFDQVPFNFPILERREQESVRLLVLESLIALDSFRSRILRGFLPLAFGFCSSPFAASLSCCSYHRCSILCVSLPVIRITIQARSPKLLLTHLLFNSGRTPKVSRPGRTRESFQDSGEPCGCTANHRGGLGEGVILSLG